ncbi:MAG: tetratricopeptide repeat protein [Candidatus Obscuribacter sp.]|nr:tetratricopeptide repeat protein [Candidatus Obscuribacter sp.]
MIFTATLYSYSVTQTVKAANARVEHTKSAAFPHQISIQSQKSAEGLYQSASSHYKSADDAGVIKDLGQAIKLNPKAPKYYVMRGHAKLNLSDKTGAKSDYESAIALSKDSFTAHLLGARIKEHKLDFIGALAEYDKAVDTKPDNLEARYCRGFTRLNLNDYAGMIEDFDIINAKHPTAWTHYLRALAFMSTHRYAEARTDLTQAIKRKKNTINIQDYYYLRSKCHSALGAYWPALCDYVTALNSSPQQTFMATRSELTFSWQSVTANIE